MIDLLENEVFKPLKDFEKSYQISNLGRMYSDYTKKLMIPILSKKDNITLTDRYILSLGNHNKKFHIYDLYKKTFSEIEYENYIRNINPNRIKSLPNEYWKAIEGYENIYEISNFCRIKSLIRSTKTWKIRKECLLTPKKSRKYYQVVLTNINGKRKDELYHRVIANAWIEKLNIDYNVINHIDNNGFNNSISNLEWCTQSMNINHCVNQNRHKGKENSRKHSTINYNIAEDIRVYKRNNIHLSYKQISINLKISYNIVKDVLRLRSWITN